jgi:hypothetical protein
MTLHILSAVACPDRADRSFWLISARDPQAGKGSETLRILARYPNAPDERSAEHVRNQLDWNML